MEFDIPLDLLTSAGGSRKSEDKNNSGEFSWGIRYPGETLSLASAIPMPSGEKGNQLAAEVAIALKEAGEECRKNGFTSELDGLVVRGALSKETVRRIIRENMRGLYACYTAELIRQPSLEGKIAVRFIINGPNGVEDIAVAHSSIKSRRLEKCVTGAISKWQFPLPEDSGKVFVFYPLLFTAGDTGGDPD